MLTGEEEFPVIFNGFKEWDCFYEHLAEACVNVFVLYDTKEQEQHRLFRRMLQADVKEKLKLCHEDDKGGFVHANLDIRRNFLPVDPVELTRTESYALQHFIKIQYHFLVYLKDILQEEDAQLPPCFQWKVEKGQLLELCDALQDYIKPTSPMATQKYWFESFFCFLQVKCPVNLNQELQKKRNRYVPDRFLQELQSNYLHKCQKIA